MPPGVALVLLSYLLYSICDAITKALGLGLSVFQIAFFSALFALVPVVLTTPRSEGLLTFWKLKHPWLGHIRGLCAMGGNILGVYAFTTIPLADTYSLAFLAPIFVVMLSVPFLKETVSPQRWVYLAASFAGVLLVVQPGFRDLGLGHLAVTVSAIFGAVNVSILRHIAAEERRVSIIGVGTGYILVFNLVMIFVSGAPAPDLHQLAWLGAIGLLGGSATVLFVASAKMLTASVIGPLQYSQIAWAVIFGALFFREFPHPLGYVGLIVVAVAGILNVRSGETRIRVFSRNSPAGAGPASAVETAASPD